MKFHEAFKFNPNHDEKGRFSAGDGVGFASPQTKEGLSFGQATHELSGAAHADMAQQFKQVDALLGINARTQDALGAWSDGAENSTVTRYNAGIDYQTLKTSMAMKGLLANQKAVVTFKRDATGKNAMYWTDVNTKDYAALHEQLLQSGVEFHTIVPTSSGARIWAFDSSDDGAGAKSFTDFAGLHNDRSHVIHGTGEFVGSWNSREEGRQAYETQIAAFFGQRPNGRRLQLGWDGLLADSAARRRRVKHERTFGGFTTGMAADERAAGRRT